MHLSNVNRTENCWNRFGIQCAVWDVFMYFYFLSLFLMKPKTESPWITKLATTKNIEPWNTQEKKFWPQLIPTEKSFRPTKYPREKFWTHVIPTRKNFGPTKYQREKTWWYNGTMTQWHQTQGTRDGTWSTKFSAPLLNTTSQLAFQLLNIPTSRSSHRRYSVKRCS